MAAVDEEDAVTALFEPFQIFLFGLIAVPQETEIPQNDQGVALFQFFQGLFFKARKVAVDITRYIDQSLTPLSPKSLYKRKKS